MMHPESSALAERLKKCAKIIGSVSEMARRAGVSRTTIENYLAGATEPKVSALVEIARAANVSLEWLATGLTGRAPETEEGNTPSSTATQIDPQIMGMIVDAVRAMYRTEGAAIPDRTLGEEASRIYMEIAPSPNDPAAALIALGEALADRRRRLRESAATPDRSKRPA